MSRCTASQVARGQNRECPSCHAKHFWWICTCDKCGLQKIGRIFCRNWDWRWLDRFTLVSEKELTRIRKNIRRMRDRRKRAGKRERAFLPIPLFGL